MWQDNETERYTRKGHGSRGKSQAENSAIRETKNVAAFYKPKNAPTRGRCKKCNPA